MKAQVLLAAVVACGALGLADRGARAGNVDTASAVAVTLPQAGKDPVTFKTPDGKEGWVRKISAEPLPTPAYAGGRVFAAGGYGSNAFVALVAGTGKHVWSHTTIDNGPTSPVANDKYVAFNTESCHTEVLEVSTGKPKWAEVTGGTLLTQPALVANGLVIPHPRMDRKAMEGADGKFRMLGLNLDSFQHAWDIDMTGDVLSAPVGNGKAVYFACTDGRLFCNTLSEGGSAWHVKAGATSAPVVTGNIVAVTGERQVLGQTRVGIKRFDATTGKLKDEALLAETAVTAAAADRNGWDYQGPKVVARKDRLFFAPGNTVAAVGAEDGKVAWQHTLKGVDGKANTLLPPALGKENVYIGSKAGHLVVLKQSDGSAAGAYTFSQGMASPPILAEGNVYFGTANGDLVCLKLGTDASDWHAWGGNAEHNKVD